MPEKTFARLCAIPRLAASALVAFGQNAPATLTIHPDQPVSPVSPTLYGLMTEEINYSYDGGLYAEMVRNRTFRGDWSGILYWYLVEDGNARAKHEHRQIHRPQHRAPRQPQDRQSNRPTRTTRPASLNVGCWGMAAPPNTEYKGSLYAKADSADLGPITVSLVNDNTGKAVATATVSGSRHGLEAIHIHSEDRRNRALGRPIIS